METFFPRTSTLILNENETLVKSLGWQRMRWEREARLVGERNPPLWGGRQLWAKGQEDADYEQWTREGRSSAFGHAAHGHALNVVALKLSPWRVLYHPPYYPFLTKNDTRYSIAKVYMDRWIQFKEVRKFLSMDRCCISDHSYIYNFIEFSILFHFSDSRFRMHHLHYLLIWRPFYMESLVLLVEY